MPPSSDEQIRFLVNLQRLLDEGQFVASYKFALLLALADSSVERGDDSGEPLALTTAHLAEKFIQYYWRQAMPYVTSADARILQQNTGQQAAVLNILRNARRENGGSLPAVMNGPVWKSFVRDVAAIVKVMPLWKLQTVGQQRLDFLYDNAGTGTTIELRAGVAYCMRKFHGLISDLVRGAWVRYVRRQNMDVLGETADLNEFLFGSERAGLAAVRPVLMEIQHGACFYCGLPLKPGSTDVDHFIAWSRYPLDLGHNFVLADNKCSGKKRDRMASYEHLAAWSERNLKYGEQIAAALEERGILSEMPASNRVPTGALCAGRRQPDTVSFGSVGLMMILTILSGLVGAVIGFASAGFGAAMVLVSVFGDHDGGSSMAGFFTFGPIGSIAGVLLGAGLALRFGHSSPKWGLRLMMGAGIVSVLGGVLLAVVSTPDRGPSIQT